VVAVVRRMQAVNLDAIPSALRTIPRWVCWRLETRRDKWGQLISTKVPKDPKTGRNASCTDPATWADFYTACTAPFAHDGIGIVLTGDEGLVGGDLDKCRDPETGAIHPTAATIIERVDTYTETSPSAHGLRFLGFATLPADHPCRAGKIEVYSRARFLTITGQHVPNTPTTLTDITSGLHWLFRTHFQIGHAPPVRRNLSPERGSVDDNALIERALKARNGANFAKLWAGEWEGLGYTSQSEADLALLSHLAYWADGDGARMERLFAASGLARPKWFVRADYRTRTLARALAGIGHA
jgi:putative DNA primase/helicase